jgi:predicted esterase/predicted GH43/DUF377 family glycosyl hydrolase
MFSFVVMTTMNSLSQTTFNKYVNNPVFEPSPTGWDSRAIENQTIIYKDSIYHMWYNGSDLEDYYWRWNVGYATSKDGLNWNKNSQNPVLEAGKDYQWDKGIGWPVVLYDSGVYHMWYAGFNQLYSFDIGYATSPDGINWTKHPDNPVMKKGLSGSWESGFILPSSVIKDENGFYMWYLGAITPASIKVGYATSQDGINWDRYNQNPLSDLDPIWMYGDGHANCDVIKKDGIFHIYYFYGKPWTEFTDHDYNPEMWIGYATSTDGIGWEIQPENPILKSSYFNWDIPWIGAIIEPPRILIVDDEFKMWYGMNRKIGYASASLPEFVEKGAGGIFEKRNHVYNGTSIPYRLFIPDDYDSTYLYPLVLTLHGTGQRGSDNFAQIMDPSTTCFSYAPNQEKYPCIVVAPQCPDKGWWATYLANIDDLLNKVIDEFSIDENRIYITGYSMGGYMTFDMINNYPNRFAAAVPIAGDMSEYHQVTNIDHILLWIFHGTADANVSVLNSRDVVMGFEQINKQFIYTHVHNDDLSTMPDSMVEIHINNHCDFLYTEYYCEQHDINEIVYSNPRLLQWLFSKYKRDQNAILINGFTNYKVLSGTETITWSSPKVEDSVDIWFRSENEEIWELVAGSIPNSGSYEWNTMEFDDCSSGQIKILLKDSAGNIYGKSLSNLFGIDNTIGTRDIKAKDYINIYPNPTEEFITIQFPKSDYYYLEITTLNGQIIQSNNFMGNLFQIDLSSFQKGVYFVTVRSKDYVRTEKLIKL